MKSEKSENHKNRTASILLTNSMLAGAVAGLGLIVIIILTEVLYLWMTNNWLNPAYDTQSATDYYLIASRISIIALGALLSLLVSIGIPTVVAWKRGAQAVARVILFEILFMAVGSCALITYTLHSPAVHQKCSSSYTVTPGCYDPKNQYNN